MNTRKLVLLSFFFFLTLGSFQNLSYGRKYEKPTTSNAVRVRFAKELLGRKLAKKMGVNNMKLAKTIDTFIHEKIKSTQGPKKKIRVRQIANTVIEEAGRYGMDPMFLMAVIKRESSFRSDIRGDFGEIGFMQIKPSTGQWIAKKYDLPWWGERSLLDPVQNIKLGAAYLDYLRKRLPEQGQFVSAYNMGPTNVRRNLASKHLPREYLTTVMDNYEELYSEALSDVLDSNGLVVAGK
jgi:soluble lytic murein transglycosylase